MPAELIGPPPPQTIIVVEKGPPGEKGDPGEKGEKGEPGPAGQTAEKAFAVADDRWEFVHNLGFTPSVGTYRSPDGRQIRGIVTVNDGVRTVVEFYVPVAGRMTLS